MTTDTIECPFCAELIKAKAKKCKHCGELLGVGLTDEAILADFEKKKEALGIETEAAPAAPGVETAAASPAPTTGQVAQVPRET